MHKYIDPHFDLSFLDGSTVCYRDVNSIEHIGVFKFLEEELEYWIILQDGSQLKIPIETTTVDDIWSIDKDNNHVS